MTDQNNQGREKHTYVRTDTLIIMNTDRFEMIIQSAVRTHRSFTYPLPCSKGICLHYGATSNAIKKKFKFHLTLVALYTRAACFTSLLE